jgi:hypothetical protein
LNGIFRHGHTEVDTNIVIIAGRDTFMSDSVNCDKCGVEQREEDGPIISDGVILC